ncbi:MAG: hypothetical protein IKI01_02280 [Lachnospiraceae bacterium]|nr:hypothetical protein [Lachnospiraceae bacterium]
MSEEEFMDALTDIDEKYIEKAFIAQDVLDELEKGSELASFRRKKLYIIAACIMIVIFGIVLASVTHWLLQGKTGNADEEYEANDIYVEKAPTPTHYSIEQGSSLRNNNTSLCEIYQFLLFGEVEYSASIEHSDRIGAEIGAAKVRNEEKESKTTLYKDVIIYEVVGVDTTIAVLVYYPEEKEYYVYYNSLY